MALLILDQGRFIMGCPAATLLSKGLTDEGECSQLWRQESRLQELDKDQLLQSSEKSKERRMKKNLILHMIPYAFQVLTNRSAL